METTISKWGNSAAVRIPKDILAQSGLKEDSPVEIRAEEGKVILSQPVPQPKRRKYTLEELLKDTTPEAMRSALDPEFHTWWQSSLGREIIDD